MAGEWSVGSATVDLIADLSKLTKGLNDAEALTKQKGSKIGDVFGTAFSFATGTVIAGAVSKLGGAVTGFFSDAIGESRDAKKAMAQTAAVIKSTGKVAGVSAEHVADLASSLSLTTLASDDQVQAAENLLLTFTNVQNKAGEGNDIFDRTTILALDMAQALGTDASSAAMQLGKALNDPLKGMAALQRSGVTFTEEQKAQVKKMQEAGDLIGAQNVILGEVAKEFSGSAEAAAGADGGWHKFNQRLSDVKQTIGDALMPALTSMMTWLSGPGLDMVEKFGTGFAHWLSDTAIPAVSRFVTTVQGIALHVKEAFEQGGIKGAVDTLLFDIGKVIPGMQPVTDFLRDVAPPAVDASTTAWGLFRDSIITFKQAWEGDWKNADSILPLHQAVGNFAIDARNGFNDLATIYIPAMAEEWQKAMPENQRLIENLTNFLNNHFFPEHKAGMNAQEKATRDYGIQVGKTTEEAKKSWADYAFSTDNDLTHLNNRMNEEAAKSHENLLAWGRYFSEWGNTVLAETRKIIGYIHNVTEAVNDLWNRLWSLTHTSWKVPIDQGGSGVGGGGGSGFGGGGGGGSGDDSGFGGGGGAPPPATGGRGPNFYVNVQDKYGMMRLMRKTGN